MDVEELMRRLASFGVTAMLKADHERFEEGGDTWTFLISGGKLHGEPGYVRSEEPDLGDCIRIALSRLLRLGDEWQWVREFIEGAGEVSEDRE